MKPVFFTAARLAACGSGEIPPELISNTHLIYSSPATLAFNSPGAEGYGVKRAGLAVPESVMLIISPGCCGRNTSAISRMPGYENRFFYLTMNETDLVTGRHLKKIPKAVEEICRVLEQQGKKPRAVMLCITCVDALLGTDMERICRRAQEKVPGVRVQPCYMYALTREGRKPPMVHVRQSIYELLDPRKKKASSVNLLGFFAPLMGTGAPGGGGMPFGKARRSEEEAPSAGSELPDLLRQAGVRTIRQIGACRSYDEFQEMAEANFNLVLNPEARPAAYDLQERLGIPFIELTRFYQIDRIEAQYAALGKVLQTSFQDSRWKTEAQESIAAFRDRYPDAVFSIGEAMNGNPFELACALVREGFAVKEIFGTVQKDSAVWIRILAALSPDTRIYSNLHPTMLYYAQEETEGEKVTVSVGRDAAWYHPEVPNVQWISDIQPFGYRAVTGLFRALLDAMEGRERRGYAPAVALGDKDREISGAPAPGVPIPGTPSCGTRTSGNPAPGTPGPVGDPGSGDAGKFPPAGNPGSGGSGKFPPVGSPEKPPAGFRRFTTPFAPDQSGAVSVLFDMGGICVICDAGGCTGNICGFDEPRWFGQSGRSAVFSAGLRDMDAILGRDDRLVEKLAAASEQIRASFASIVGTPVPAVIGTDYRALCRMAEKKTGLPVLGINTDGMEYYDRGMEKAYLALLDKFCRNAPDIDIPGKSAEDRTQAGESASGKRILGIWGWSPLDFAGIASAADLREWARSQGFDEVLCPGAGASVEALRLAGDVEKNIVLSPAGTAAAKWLEKEYGTPWEYAAPHAEDILRRTVSGRPPTASGVRVSSERPGVRGSFPLGISQGVMKGGRYLVVHQQVLARTLCGLLLQEGAERADAACFFMTDSRLMQPGDAVLREENDLRDLLRKGDYDYVIGDRALEALLEGLEIRFLHLPHFAVSGEQSQAF